MDPVRRGGRGHVDRKRDGISDYDNITFDGFGNVISNATGLPVNVKYQWQ